MADVIPSRQDAVGLASPSNDAADFLLSSLFGPGWQNVITNHESGGFTTMLFALFELFNSTVLIGVGLLITWTIITGVAGAAYEGRGIGEKQGQTSMWTPTRMAFSIAMLMPLPGLGLSALQALVLILVASSVNMANSLNEKAIDVMVGGNTSGMIKDGEGNKPLRPLVFDMANTFRQDVTSVFKMSALSKLDGAKSPPSAIVQFDEASGVNNRVWAFTMGEKGKSVVVGKFSIKCSDGIWDKSTKLTNYSVCDDRVTVYNSMIKKVDVLTTQLMSNKALVNDKLTSCPAVGGAARTQEQCIIANLNNIGNEIAKDIGADLGGYVSGTEDSAWKKEVKAEADAIRKGGFLLLGSYYLKITKLNKLINDALKTDTVSDVYEGVAVKYATAGAVERFFKGDETKRAVDVINNIVKFSAFSGNEELYNRVTGDESLKTESIWTNSMRAHYSGTKSAAYVIKSLTGGNEPISALQNIGLGLITAADGLVITVATLTAFSHTAEKTGERTANAIGNAGGAIPLVGSAAATAAILAVTPITFTNALIINYKNLLTMFVQPALTALTLMSFFLAYYLPALPAILWLLAVLGWLILVIEAVIAAPVWAAAHAMPEGEGIAGQHGRQGYMMLINILLRPALMVIGFYMSIALISAFAMFSVFITENALISNLESKDGVIENLISSGALISFLMSFASGIIIIGSTLIIVIHKSLNLVTWLPENAIKWAGGQGASLGEQSDERRVAALLGSMGPGARGGQKPPGLSKAPGGDDKGKDGPGADKDPATTEGKSGDGGVPKAESSRGSSPSGKGSAETGSKK